MTEQKSWVCESCGVIIGRIYYSGNHPTLRLENVVVTGECEFLCECGHLNLWEPNAQALSYLIKKRNDRREKIRKAIEEIDKGLTNN